MTLDKAIKILSASLKCKIPDFDLDEIDAVKLGIEALKLIKLNRHPDFPVYIGLLSGETKE